jgi:polygalacturonase
VVGLLVALFAGAAGATPALPVIPTNVFNVINYGAVGDSMTTNTTAIQNAINAANAAGGGIVEIPPAAGGYLCGPITLKSSVNLKIDGGAILQMLPFGKYPLSYTTNVSGSVTTITWTAANFISASSLHDIALSGAGAIDGQGGPWWPYAYTNGDTRPRMIAWSACNRELIEDVTLSNAPMFHIAIGGKAGNSTVQRVIVRAPSSGASPPSHNTDACDVSGTNILVQNCNISVGDDNYTCGGGTSDVLITNNTYGYGHGISIGSYTSPSVSNLTAINCTLNNTDNGIRIKSDRDRGGLVQNIRYCNLRMTNITYPILIYGYYTNTLYGSVNSLTPALAAQDPGKAVTSTTPAYRNLVISNVTATAQSGRICGLIWAVPEAVASNVTLVKVTISGSKPFGIYHARAVKLEDCQFTVPGTITNLAFCDAEITITNSTPSTNLVKLDGVSTSSYTNKLSFFNALATLRNTNALGTSPVLTLGGSNTFIISNHFAPAASSVFNFNLGTNGPTIIHVVSNLDLRGTINITAGGGFTSGSYTLFTCGGKLATNNLSLGTMPGGFGCTLATNTGGQVDLIVSAPVPPAPANLGAAATNLLINLRWDSVSGATSYNLKRGTATGGPYPTVYSGLTATNHADANVTNTVTYYYVVTAVEPGGESTNSLEAAAAPLPSSQKPSMAGDCSGSTLMLTWPFDHIGWRLQTQTNSLVATNWVEVPGAATTNVLLLNPGLSNGCVFYRLIYP